MLRGPVQASLPTLEHFQREAGTSGHVYPFPARSTSPGVHQSADLRLPASIASATFWRSPYSEVFRQRTSGSKRQSNDTPRGQETHERERGGAKGEKGAETVKSILKNGGSEGRDSGSDTSSENARGQIRGILCKSSLSSSSRQSGSKVQKRVKFDDSVDSKSVVCQRHASSAGSSGASSRGIPRNAHDHHRAMSASAAGRSPLRMPTLRADGDRLQSIDKACLSNHSNHPHTSPNQHVHRPSSSGALVRCGSVPDLALPRPAIRDPYKHQHPCSYQLLHSPHSSTSGGVGNGSARLSPNSLEFKIYRRSAPVQNGSPSQGDASPTSQPNVQVQAQAQTQGRARFFTTRSGSSGSRAMVRLTRSLTSPAITVSRPVKRPTPSCTQDDLPLVLTSTRVYPQTHATTIHPDYESVRSPGRSAAQGMREDEDEEDEDQQTFLDEDKTVQILHWLEEVDHKQAREGRCPVFVNNFYREG